MAKQVLLALSSFRWSDAEIDHALDRCAGHGYGLTAVFVVDINLARYFVGSEVMAGTSLREQMEHGIMEDHRLQAREILERVQARAAERGVPCKTVLREGRFAQEVRQVAAEEGSEVIVLTRARRPDWLRRLFGSPVDRLCEDLGGQCEIDILK